jgi:hypothetical protein
MPEGLPTGDRFDVFSGDVATLSGGLSLAQSLACDVAAGAIVGERVDVFDPLPDPAPGQARYYLTVVTSGVERRAGRRREAGVLSGRSVEGLPSCPG